MESIQVPPRNTWDAGQWWQTVLLYNKMMRFLFAGGMAIVVAGCAVTEPAPTGVSNPPAAASAATVAPAAPAAAPEEPIASQPLSAGQIARNLIGTTYARKRAVPKTIGDDWAVATVIKPAGRDRSDFLAIAKDDMLVLMHATAATGSGGERFVIRDAWAVARHENLLQAACLPMARGKSPVFALVHRGAVDQIVLAAQVTPGTDQIAGIDKKTGAAYRCRYRAGRTGVVRKLVW